MATTYCVYFLTAAGAAEATRRLQAAGFEVKPELDQAPAEAPYGIEARIADGPYDADAQLDAAIAGIPHDPFVVWQHTQLTDFARRSD